MAMMSSFTFPNAKRTVDGKHERSMRSDAHGFLPDFGCVNGAKTRSPASEQSFRKAIYHGAQPNCTLDREMPSNRM